MIDNAALLLTDALIFIAGLPSIVSICRSENWNRRTFHFPAETYPRTSKIHLVSFYTLQNSLLQRTQMGEWNSKVQCAICRNGRADHPGSSTALRTNIRFASYNGPSVFLLQEEAIDGWGSCLLSNTPGAAACYILDSTNYDLSVRYRRR